MTRRLDSGSPISLKADCRAALIGELKKKAFWLAQPFIGFY
ncbi:hypothetical protein [Rhizobium sp. 3T7]|nr:hypothetical protein [Rhizobium sp. 3T7]